jgi:tRNA uridine 5-carboxymethylaminomethyl modification enzyme
LTAINSSEIREPQTIAQLLRRPEIGLTELKRLNSFLGITLNTYPLEIQEQVAIRLKYESYIEREQKMAEKIESLSNYIIKTDFDYDRVKALSSEGREKLKKIKPETIGQASRISGVNPSDISVLTIYMGK